MLFLLTFNMSLKYIDVILASVYLIKVCQLSFCFIEVIIKNYQIISKVLSYITKYYANTLNQCISCHSGECESSIIGKNNYEVTKRGINNKDKSFVFLPVVRSSLNTFISEGLQLNKKICTLNANFSAIRFDCKNISHGSAKHLV